MLWGCVEQFTELLWWSGECGVVGVGVGVCSGCCGVLGEVGGDNGEVDWGWSCSWLVGLGVNVGWVVVGDVWGTFQMLCVQAFALHFGGRMGF